MSYQFPGRFDSPASLWRLLVEERGAVGPVPPGRWDAEWLMALQDPDEASVTEVVERAGLPVGRLRGTRTGVYVGAYTLDNLLRKACPVEDALDRGICALTRGSARTAVGFRWTCSTKIAE
ncbi:hypothetical protein QZH56_15735 [Streptomyces olivoreticuli]|uniref:hypothetical protein n=1 Tax=Streptomyces olivoreticuli TaxID=68246 RepID=UPI00265A3AC1|nr:hypothetical protein [Streptomyces olivoreticuli]WKK21938.1 hypothetical protein QZH56_24390 [Streptomyces olivoreticuli]WKK26915.1 hypothetical protein QZH56_15735 [Streptomyces olivoreticuli]